jgi:hypothetical protein
MSIIEQVFEEVPEMKVDREGKGKAERIMLSCFLLGVCLILMSV